jgi:hypothetical protein
MRKLATLSFGSAALVVASTACLFTTSLDGYDDAQGGPDATSDGSLDGGGGADGSGDGGVDATVTCDAGFCACQGAGHDLCFDFDGLQAITGWKSATESGGTVEFVDAGGFSPPASMRARIPALQSGTGIAYLELLEQRAASKLKVEMDIAVDEGDTVPNNGNGVHGACPMTFRFSSGSEIRVDLYAEHGDVEQIAGGGFSADDVAIPTAAGARGRIGLWVDIPAMTCGLTFDGVEKLPACKLRSGFTAGTSLIRLGLAFVRPPTSSWAIRVDNVTIDYD